MRRTDAIRYHRLETVRPVQHKSFNKNLELVTVTRRYRWDDTYPIADTRALLRRMVAAGRLQGYGRVNLRKLTVSGAPVRAVPVRPAIWPEQQFSICEIDAPDGFCWWEVLPGRSARARVRLSVLTPWDERREMDANTSLGARIRADKRYMPPVYRPLPDNWIVCQPFIGYIQGAGRAKPSAPAAEQALRRMLADERQQAVESALGGLDWDEAVKITFPRRGRWPRPKNQIEITGQRLRHPDKCLYRILHYFCGGRYNPRTRRDAYAVRIDDFYKGGFLKLEHHSLPAWVWLEFWKCELAVRLYADPAICKQRKPGACIRLGEPGAQSDEWRSPQAVMAWYRLLLRVLKMKTCIYGGNDFCV